MPFTELNLNSLLIKAISASGFSEPTDIQREAIPVVLSGRDLMASAQTGTGKTAAFVLPALEKLLSPSPGQGQGPRVLVLTPTRELAMQVSDNVRQFGKFGRFTTGNVVGGLPYPPQIRLLNQPIDILVATPGRLMDHMEAGRVNFSRLEMLVLDEADRMLDMGFVNAVRRIAAATPSNRQTLLFSATLEGSVLKIAKELLNDPARIQLAVNHARHDAIDQRVHQADDSSHKHSLLAHYLSCDTLSQAVIFTATKRGADKLARSLAARGHASAALHGNMNQSQRKRTVVRVRKGHVKLLVATDVAARGLDIKGISHVINFDMPTVAEDYIHRIGRTGRGGATGMAVSLVGPDDWQKLSSVERLTGRKLERETIVGLEPTMPEPRFSRGRPGDNSRRRPGSGARSGFGDNAARKPRQGSSYKRGDSSASRQRGDQSSSRRTRPQQRSDRTF